jgi:hypothetical protein
MGDDFTPGWSGPMNAMGVVKTRDAAAKPEAWIRFGTPERGYETGERAHESGTMHRAALMCTFSRFISTLGRTCT